MIRFLLRFVGLMLLALAFIFVVYDGMKSIADATFYATKVNQLWVELHSSSLEALQALVDRKFGPNIWPWAVAPVLRQPAAAVFGVLGLLLIILGRKKRPLIGYARD